MVVYFSGSAIGWQVTKVLNREQAVACGSNTSSPTKNVRWLAYRPGRTPVGNGRVCSWYSIVLGSIPDGAAIIFPKGPWAYKYI
jgi:hypothetical protein